MPADDLLIEPFVDEDLGNSAYLVASRAAGTAVLIDPLRDVDRYRAAAEGQGLRLTHVLDTHLHADFVTGARELAAQVGAEIGAGAAAGLEYVHRPLSEGDVLPLGPHTLRVLATPGHSPEHISFVLHAAGRSDPLAAFTGGALIVGGAARTDLLGHEVAAPLARQLYHSLHDKLLRLPDAVAVYPTHGAGSFCVAAPNAERTTTIGRERRANPLAQALSEDAFVDAALRGLPSYPAYYKEMRPLNRRGPRVLGGLPPLPPLSPAAVAQAVAEGALVLDVRPNPAFAAAHLPGAFGIQLDAPLSTWAGWLVPFGAPLVLVAEDAAERTAAVRQLIRIGYDDLRGYLEGGPAAWEAAGYATAHIPTLTVAALRARLRDDPPLTLLDVRQDAEWAAGHIPGALHIENGRLPWAPLALPPDQPLAVQCASGSRAMAGLSVLARRGFTALYQVAGGLDAWQAAGYPLTRPEPAPPA